MKKKLSQRERIRDYLASGKTLTARQAIRKFGCWRLAPVIHRLRNKGMFIINVGKSGGHAKYSVLTMTCK